MTRLRIGTFVLNNDLRHPAVLARELASLDLLSGGRLEAFAPIVERLAGK